MFGATNIVKNSDKEKYVYNGYGIAVDGKGECSFSNDPARNVIMFWVDNSSSSHTGNLKKDFLILGEGPNFRINGSFHASEKKKLILILLKQRQSFVLVCNIMLIIVTYM